MPLFVILLCQSIALYAQSNYKQGYIITNENDTLIGWIDYRTDKMNSKICRFKKDLTNETAETYVPGEIAGYRFLEEGKFYVTRNIEINGLQQTVFLEYLLQGIMNLYFFPDQPTDLNYYFFEDEDGKMIYITKRPNEIIDNGKGEFYNKKDMRYRNVLALTFQDYEPIKKEAEKLNFTHHSMIGLAKDYHNQVCTTGEACIEFETKVDNHYMKVQFSVSGGIAYQLSKHIDSNVNFKPHFSPFIKAGVDLSVPRWMKSISLSFNAYLTEIKHAYNGNVDFTEGYDWNVTEESYRMYCSYWDYSFKAYQAGVDVAAKYIYPKGKIRPSFQIGMDLFSTTFGEKIYSYKEITSTNDNSVTSQTFDSENISGNEILHNSAIIETFNIGAGIHFSVWKDRFLFLNVNYKMPLMLYDSTWGNKNYIWQLELGYRF